MSAFPADLSRKSTFTVCKCEAKIERRKGLVVWIGVLRGGGGSTKVSLVLMDTAAMPTPMPAPLHRCACAIQVVQSG